MSKRAGVGRSGAITLLILMVAVSVSEAGTAPTRPTSILRHRSQSSSQVVGQTRTLLADGTVLLLGGEGPDGVVSTAAIENPQTGQVKTLARPMHYARTGHTATMLPNGMVLVFGGMGASGQIETVAELFDPASERFDDLPSTGLVPRAYHSATVLTDGDLLVAGGVSDSGITLATLELWHFSTSSATELSVDLQVSRSRQTATLLRDGTVLFWGGLNQAGSALNFGEIFDPASQRSSLVSAQPALSNRPPQVEASLPPNGSSDVAVNSTIAFRFSEPLDVVTLNARTITLAGAQGLVDITAVPAEGGRLVFVNPKSVLPQGATFTLAAEGPTDSNGTALPLTAISFTTFNSFLNQTSTSGTGVLNSSYGDGDLWIPTAANFEGTWTSGHGQSQWQKLPALQAKPEVTALAGQALRLNGSPLKGVTLEIGGQKATTDGTGRFLLQNLTAGHQALLIDGRTANTSQQTYGIYEVGVDLVAGQTTALNYTIWMTRLDTAHAVTIPSPTTAEMVVTTPLLPGLALHLPANTVIRDHNGSVVTKISITPIPIDQPPFPLPPGLNVPIYFTIQPGDAYIDVSSASWTKGARLFYPNSHNAKPGTLFNFWNYDAEQKGWYVYGQGQVSSDGSQIVPDPGVEIYEFTGAMVGQPSAAPAQGPTCVIPPCKTADPVDLSTGLFVYNKTDLTLTDVIPLTLQRTYRTNDSQSRPFGIGATQYYEMFIVGDIYPYTYQELILPEGARIYFQNYAADGGTYIPDADFEHTSTQTIWYGATITWNNATNSGWILTRKDGMKFFFPEATAATNPAIMALVGIQDRYGNSVEIDRDSVGNVTQVTSPNGRYISFQHDTSNRITQAQDSIGRTVSYSYDSSGRLSTVTDANGGVTTYTYDSNNNMLTIEDALGITYLTNQFDSNGRVTKQTLADGTTYQFAWTPTTTTALTFAESGGGSSLPPGGSATQVIGFRSCSACSEGYMPLISKVDVTDPIGNVREVQFGSTGQLTSDTYALGTSQQQVFTYSYYADNLLQSVLDPLSRTASYSYDAKGNVTAVTKLTGTSSAVTASFSYDPNFSQLTGATDPLSHTTSLAVDGSGNTTSITDPLSHQTTVTYNSEGQVTSVTDPLSNETQFTYSEGDLVSITDPLSRTTNRFVDSAGRLVSVTNPLGQTTKYAYDNLNEITNVIDPLNGQTSFGYDANGNLTSVTDAKSHTTSYTYNNMNRLTNRTDPLSRSESYQYDSDGNLTQFTDRRSKVTNYTYDDLNRRTFAGFGYSGGSYESTISYTYDAGNRLTQAVDTGTGTISRTFDGLDRMTAETTPQGSVSYGYDAAGRPTSMTVGSLTAVSYTYDNANRLTQVTQGTPTVSFSYDSANRRTALTLPNGVTMSFSYDAGSQLTGIAYATSSTTLGNLTYSYDLAGRRTNMGGSYAATGLPNAQSTTTYDAANELTAWGTTTPSYDSNGNLVNDGTNTYVWNARNQLASMNMSAQSFQYDPFGRRVAKTIIGTTTNYLYDGANPVQELSGSTVTANLLTGLGIDERFTRTDSSGTANFLTDALGSTLVLTNSSASTLASYTYEPFGNTTITGSSTSTYQYTGRENDGTSLYYYSARYYDPTPGRFISEDPIRFRGGDINLYRYVWNSPIDLRDPKGLIGAGFSLNAGGYGGASPAAVGGSVSVGGLYFPDASGNGGYVSYGGFAGSHGLCGNYQNNQTGGLSAGAGPGVVFTNANSISDVSGPFNDTEYSIFGLGFGFAYSPSNGVWTLNISAGYGTGLGFSQYVTNTITNPVSPSGPGCSCDH
jgi:RHS repeat-associated protein